jgi:hypothetical protein
MWWFDSETGFWIEDGVGTVQVSDTSETGLKLVATVNHFTTWNWDYYKQDDRSSITFKCLKNGLPLAADESCNITAESTSINRQFIASSEGITVLNTPPNVTYSVTANSGNGNPFWAGRITLTTVAGDNTAIVNMQSAETKIGYVQCRIINNAVTSIVPCTTLISAGSINNQNIDSADFSNLRAPFLYAKGDVLDIFSSMDSSLNQRMSVDTSSINGTLDIEVIFDIQVGSLQCSAMLNNSDMQYFPCDALVTDSNDSTFPIWTSDFSGTPPKANFTYSKNAQTMSFEVASIFNTGILREYNNRYYISGEGTLVSIDLTREAAIAQVTYDIQSGDLYTFKCIDELSNNIDCNITWYNSMEAKIFEGNIDELVNPDILPTWMNGKVFIEDPDSGFGSAWLMLQNRYFSAESYEIDSVNGVIIFTLVEQDV